MFLEAEVAELEAEIDQQEQELVELRAFRRRMTGAFEVFSGLLDEREHNMIPGLVGIDDCEQCRSTHGLVNALRAVLAPPSVLPLALLPFS